MMGDWLIELEARRRQSHWFDEELWAFEDKVRGRNLEHLSDDMLLGRHQGISRNIQFLDWLDNPKQILDVSRGWLSPFWWYRAKFWTELELGRRKLETPEVPYVEPLAPTVPQCLGVLGGGKPLLFRISRLNWLLDFLHWGHLRFNQASNYRNDELNPAQFDNEMKKGVFAPGSQFTIVHEITGQNIEALGYVNSSVSRSFDDKDFPYYIMCFSSEVDIRLFGEFSCDDYISACLIVFDVEEFLRRASRGIVGQFEKVLCPVNYYDPYYTKLDDVDVILSKDFSYACQREMRLCLDPVTPDQYDTVVEFNIGSLVDIAGIYNLSGERIIGSGPMRLLSDSH